MKSLKHYIANPAAALRIYCVLLFVYIAYRAVHLSFTFDEVSTIQLAGGQDWNNLGLTANNHFLNVCLIKFFSWIFAPTELVYRLPNVLAFVLYLVYALKIGRLLKGENAVYTLILLTSMPFVMDFFSLARGYGLALSFILASLFYLLQYIKVNRFMLALYSLLFGALAVLSNLTSINYFLPSIIVMLGATALFLDKAKRGKRLAILLALFIAFMAMILPIVFELKNQGALFFGGRDGFYTDTILSLGRTFAYFKLNLIVGQVFFTLLFILSLIFSVLRLLEFYKKKVFDVTFVLPLVYLLAIAAPILQHLLFQTSLPVERTALLYFPLMVLVLINGAEIISTKSYKIGLNVLTVLFFGQFIYSSNFTHSYSWKFDSGSKEVLTFLKKEKERELDYSKIKLGTDYLVHPSLWFYGGQLSLDGLELHDVVGGWEYDMHLEELDPIYYGWESERKNKMSKEDLEKLLATDLDYYYLSDFVVNELIRNEVSLSIIKHVKSANFSLIEIN